MEKGLQKTLTEVTCTSEREDGHENKHTEDRMPISGRRKQEVSPGGGRTGIEANGELCLSWEEISAQGCGKENWVGEGNLAGAGEGVELQGTEQGH